MLSFDRFNDELSDLLMSFDSDQPVSSAVVVNVDAAGVDRIPQWTAAETRELLAIRSELDRTFQETKRNKVLWEVVATRMREKGFNRSAEQCKCKWKNLVTRYKGCEALEPEVVRQQFPFYDELQSIFAARIQRMLWTEVSGFNKHKLTMSSEEEEEESLGRKKKARLMISPTNGGSSSSSSSSIVVDQVKEMLESFMKQQMEVEVQWREAVEARESERTKREMEWRNLMEAMERERVEMERRWHEREEERRSREEMRAQRRDELITALLNKLNQGDDDRV